MHAGAWFCPLNFVPPASALPRSGSVQQFVGANVALGAPRSSTLAMSRTRTRHRVGYLER